VSRGFRDADTTQALSDQAVATAIERILDRGRDEALAAASSPEDPRYGRCQDCGGGIGEERLEALPTAIRCVRCQAAWEQSHPY